MVLRIGLDRLVQLETKSSTDSVKIIKAGNSIVKISSSTGKN